MEALDEREDGLTWTACQAADAWKTLARLLAIERELIETALAGVGAAAAIADRRALAHALSARPLLAEEQVVMVQCLARDGDRVAIVVGPAGTGETVALAAAREAWEASGITVEGAGTVVRAPAVKDRAG